jgi:hypothetical protein
MTDQQPPQEPQGWERQVPERWEQYERERAQWSQPPPPPPQRPRQSASAGRIVLGAVVGALLGFVAPFLPGFLYAVLTGESLDLSAAVLALLMVVAVPCGALLGGLWAARRSR